MLGVRFGPMFPGNIALVSMSMYGLLALLFALDLGGVKARLDERTPIRLIGGFLIGTSLFFAALWLGLTASSLAARRALDPVTRFVIAIDGVVLLPLMFFGGLWLWRRRPLGYALAGLLLVKVAATFLTLVATALVTVRAGQSVDPIQTSAYVAGMVGTLALLVSYLRHTHRSELRHP